MWTPGPGRLTESLADLLGFTFQKREPTTLFRTEDNMVHCVFTSETGFDQ